MASADTVYRYDIPLENTGGTSSPLYRVSGNGETLSLQIKANNVVMVCTEACPHFHKDSINVGVEEVEKSEYKE